MSRGASPNHHGCKDPDNIYFHDDYCCVFRQLDNQMSSDRFYNFTGRAAFEMSLIILLRIHTPSLIIWTMVGEILIVVWVNVVIYMLLIFIHHLIV